MLDTAPDFKTRITRSDWYKELAKYEKPDLRKAIWQLLDTFVPYAALWILMICMIRQGVSYLFVLPLTLLAGGMLIRIFIFFHDCCHGSFFASRRANRILGYISGILTFTPYEDWRHQHAEHHATTADLDRRGVGDIWTLTVEEYLTAPLWKRLYYRFFRNPFVLFGLGPPIQFLIAQRFPGKEEGKRERRSIAFTNLAILAIIGLASVTIGLRTYLLIQVPVMTTAAAIGVWLFYVQHQYEANYWERHQAWDPMHAALDGSSYYRLPKILQWFSGNIGFHHIHHLRPRIPNYNLQRCFNEIPALQAVEPLTIRRSLKSLFLNLWDETDRRMVSFRAAKRRLRQARSQRGERV